MRVFGRMLYVITTLLLVLTIFGLVARITDNSQGIRGLLEITISNNTVSMDVTDQIIFGTTQYQQISEKVKNTFEEVTIPPPPTPSSPMFILILSSLPRSGSTFFSEMMAKIKDSILFFEPLWIQHHTYCSQDTDCIEKYLGDVFTCNYDPDFEDWLKSKYLFLQYFSLGVRSCLTKKLRSEDTCLETMSLRTMCLESPVRIVKVIRARLQWLEKTLMNSTINFKLIHVTRDPRGSLNSISHMGWSYDTNTFCGGLEEDMNTYEVFSERYPSKVLQVSLETLSLHPSEEMSRVFRFLYGTSTIPELVKYHLRTHTTEDRGDTSMSTFKKSKIAFEAWRWEILEDLWRKVETEPPCLRSIQRMNHTVFGFLELVRNSSVPLILT